MQDHTLGAQETASKLLRWPTRTSDVSSSFLWDSAIFPAEYAAGAGFRQVPGDRAVLRCRGARGISRSCGVPLAADAWVSPPEAGARWNFRAFSDVSIPIFW